MKIEQKLSIPIFIMFIGNLIDCIKDGSPLMDYLSHVLPFFLIGVFLLLFPRRKTFKNEKQIISAILLFLSGVGVWFGGGTNLLSITLFCFSIYISNPKSIFIYLYLIILSVSIMLKFSIDQYEPIQTILYLAGSSFLYIIYQHYIHPKIKDNSNPQELLKTYDSRKVKDQVVDIVHLKVQGYDWPEINDILMLNVANDRVRRIVTDERKRLGFKNQDEFIFWMTTSGIIKPIPANLVIEA